MEDSCYVCLELYQVAKPVAPVLDRLMVELKSMVRKEESINDDPGANSSC